MSPRDLQHPIGVFDSGVGGLTVLRALHEFLPRQDLLYIGDSARVPYGRKPREMVCSFAHEIARYLLRQKVRAIVVACNTASAAALPALADELPVPVFGVIEPGVEAATRLTRSRNVGVVATQGTVKAGTYQRKLEANGLQVWAQPCPMFVHLVEEGLAASPEAAILARHYLSDHPNIDTLILGCTHYPVLADTIQRAVGDGVRLVSSAAVTAEAVASALGGAADGSGQILHLVTGDVAAFRHSASAMGALCGDEIQHLPLAELTA